MAGYSVQPFQANHPALMALFDPDVPNNPALWAVLRGRHLGVAMVDDTLRPLQCALRTDACLTYFGRYTSQEFLLDAVGHFRTKGPVWLVWPPGSGVLPPMRPSAQVVPRIEFRDLTPHSPHLEALRGQLPPECHIRPIDRQLLMRCQWRGEMAFYCGSLDNFLENGIGLCLMRDDQIIVEAYASALGESRAELGAITWEPFRGRGYAPIACAYLIETCARRGYQPYWSCDAGNLASRRVARKLGFRQERAYKILEYEPLI